MVSLTGSSSSAIKVLSRAYDLMRARFGPQGWWPADSAFEVCVGAILTQNTNWSNVERAIAALKAAGMLEPSALYHLPSSELEELIRTAGTFRVKARRLRAFLKVLVEDYKAQLPELFRGETDTVRTRLLRISGIGPETADCLLLYASSHASFVVDAYTRRIFLRHGWIHRKASYDDLQRRCQDALVSAEAGDRREFWRDAHAQLVMVGKRHCRTRAPLCEGCPLQPLLTRGLPLPI